MHPTRPLISSASAPVPVKAKVPLIASLGLGVVGGLQICVQKRLPNETVWLAASHAEKKALKALLKSPQVAVVPYPLDYAALKKTAAWRFSSAWQKSRDKFFSMHKLDQHIPTVFFSGRLAPSKGLHQIVRLAEQQRFSIQLVLAGFREKVSRYPGEESETWQLIQKSPYCRVIELGALGRLKNYRCLTFADSVIALSTDASEDFGLLPRQALAVGTPVMVTEWGGLTDIRLRSGLDRFMIRRFRVKENKLGIPEADCNSFCLKQYFEEAASLPEKVRMRSADELVLQNRSEIREGLKQALALRNKLVQKSRNKFRTPLIYRKLSIELTLAASEHGLLDARLIFPKKRQIEIMSIDSLDECTHVS